MKTFVAAAMACSALMCGASQAKAPESELALWRLDCGSIEISDLGAFSDTGLYAGQTKTLAASCYLIRDGDRYLLWDTGVDGALAGTGKRDKDGNGLSVTLRDHLAGIQVDPSAITFVGISHIHLDHTGQVADFPNSTVLIGKGDWDIVKTWAPARKRFAHWLGGAGKIEALEADKDVFGDGKVSILRMPGHTPGHQALLVRLASGPVLISGDQYHFEQNRKVGGVPSFNDNRADTLASHDRFEKLAATLKAKVIIQHEPADIAKLPSFPASAR